MNNENLVIYDFKILYEILSEISNHINFELTYINKIKKSFFFSAMQPNVGLYFFVKWIKIALPLPINGFFVL